MSGIGGDANTMGDINRPTSRVLAPPGGGSSNIFGGPEPVQARKANPQQQSCNIFGQPIVDHNQVKKSEPKAPTPAAATQAPAAAPTQQTPTNETNGVSDPAEVWKNISSWLIDCK